MCLSPQCEEVPGGRGLGKCWVGVVRRRGACAARGALPREVVAGEGGSSGGGGVGRAPTSEP